MSDYQTKLDMELEIKGVKFEVYVSRSGEFQAVFDNVQYRHETLEGLRQRLMVATRTKSKNISVPITVLSSGYDNRQRGDDRLADAEVVGVHAGSKNLLIRVTDASGKQTTHQAAYGWTIFRRMTEAEKERYYNNREMFRRALTQKEEYEKKLAYERNALRLEVARQLEIKPEEVDVRVV